MWPQTIGLNKNDYYIYLLFIKYGYDGIKINSNWEKWMIMELKHWIWENVRKERGGVAHEEDIGERWRFGGSFGIEENLAKEAEIKVNQTS